MRKSLSPILALILLFAAFAYAVGSASEKLLTANDVEQVTGLEDRHSPKSRLGSFRFRGAGTRSFSSSIQFRTTLIVWRGVCSVEMSPVRCFIIKDRLPSG